MHKIAAWALAALMAGSMAWAQTPPTTGDDEVTLIKQGAKAYDDKNPAESTRLLKIAVDAPAFPLINEDGQRITQRILAAAAYDVKDFQTSARAARAATTYPKADGDDWAMRLWASAAIEDDVDVVMTLTTLAAKWPAKLDEARWRFISRTAFKVEDSPGGDELVARLMQAILAAKWKPDDAMSSDVDGLWVELIRFDLKWQQLDEARLVASRIEDPGALREMQTDKVFDPIVAADPARYDSDKAAERIVAPARKWAADHPDKLEAVINAAVALYTVDRQSEALALLDEAKARVDRRGKDAFKDLQNQHNWLLDTLARVLIAMGRAEDGLAEFKAGADLNENGGANINQILNLAGAYVRAGRPADALAMLARTKLENTSGYGRMVYESNRACAYAQLNDTKGLKDAMTFVDTYSGDNIGAKVQAQLCAADIDGAAATVIAELQKPGPREKIIGLLQAPSYPRLAVIPTFEQLLHDRWQALRSRPDVLKALEPYGRIMKFKTIEYG